MEVCRKLPKIELHAHLNGSISLSTLHELIKARNDLSEKVGLLDGVDGTFSLDQCFSLFEVIHSLTDNLENIKKITQDVIEDFHSEHTLYLELRTTPKHLEGKYTKAEYVQSVLDVIILCEDRLGIMVRLLLSFDRGRSVEDAESTLEVAKSFLRNPRYQKYICGIDVSGNPSKGSVRFLLPLLREAKTLGLKLAVHLMEVNTSDAFEEAKIVIEEGLVDRIGHGTFFDAQKPSHMPLVETLTTQGIPFEMCLTSNLKCGTVSNLSEHHLQFWFKKGNPTVICTDDKGIFGTSLTQEYEMCCKILHLNAHAMVSLIMHGVNAAFLSAEEKKELIAKFETHFQSVQELHPRGTGPLTE